MSLEKAVVNKNKRSTDLKSMLTVRSHISSLKQWNTIHLRIEN